MSQKDPDIKKNLNIFIIDDDKNGVRLIIKKLSQLGYTPEFAYTVSEALEKLGDYTPDLILLDYKLPDHDCRFFLDKLEEAGLNIPFIIMTAHGDEELAVEMMKLGAKDYLIKEQDFIELLLSTVNKAFKDLMIEKRLEEANETLKRSRKRYIKLFESSIDAIYITNRDGTFLEVNNAFLRMFGYSYNELMSMNSETLYENVADREAFQKEIESHGHVSDYEVRLKNKQGNILYSLIRATVIDSDLESGPNYYGVIRDITEHKKTVMLLEMQRDLGIALGSSKGLDEALEYVMDAIMQFSDIDSGGIYLLDDDSKDVILFYHKGISDEILDEVRHFSAGSYHAKFLMEKHLLGKEHLKFTESEKIFETENLKSVLVVPFYKEGVVIGSLNVGSKIELRSDSYCCKAIEAIALQAGGIIANFKAREALAESENKYRDMTDLLPQVVFELNREAEIVYLNQKTFDILGYKPEELDNKTNIFDLFDEFDSERALDNFKGLIKGLKSPGNEYQMIRKDGSTFPAMVYSSPIIAGNEVKGIRGFLIDITERKRTEEALRHSEEKYRQVVENANESIIVAQDNRLKYFNPNLVKFTLYSAKELSEKPFWNLIHPDDRSIVEGYYERRLKAEDVPSSYDFRIIRKDGKIRWVSITGVRIIWDKRPATLNFLSDITERKLAEDKIKRLNSELEERVAERTSQLEDALKDLKEEVVVRRKTEMDLLNAQEELRHAYEKEKELGELKTRFISMISHEYRTPLTVILTSTYVIEQLYAGKSVKEMGEALDRIRHSVKGMTRLLENVLTIGKSETSKLDYSPARIEVVEVVYDVIEEVKVIDKNNHDIDFQHELQSCHIYSDERLLRQIIGNLLVNATKYSEKGQKVTLDLLNNSKNISLNVIDRGIGIDQDDMAYLFEPFHRGRNTGTVSGTGLGLAIVKRCLDTMGGEIRIDSRLGEGTTFSVTLPKEL